MASNLPPLSPETIEAISKIFDELSNSEITHELQKVGIPDVSMGITKWKRIHDAFGTYQNNKRKSDAILQFCINYFKPVRFVNKDPNLFEEQRILFNRAAGFEGWEISKEGKLLRHIQKLNTIEDAEERANYLKMELQKRKSHPKIFRYCTPEILSEDYFHMVEESIKGLFDRIKEISGNYIDDGAVLIDKVMSEKAPSILINKFSSKSEISEHKGFGSMLKALYSLFRNPEAHSPKEIWPMDKTDALDILGLVSLCHRKLDKAYKIDPECLNTMKK